jgi:hypothetical protein
MLSDKNKGIWGENVKTEKNYSITILPVAGTKDRTTHRRHLSFVLI